MFINDNCVNQQDVLFKFFSSTSQSEYNQYSYTELFMYTTLSCGKISNLLHLNVKVAEC